MKRLKNLAKSLAPQFVKDMYQNTKERKYKRQLFGDLAPLVPPESLMHDGPPTYKSFQENGLEFLRIYQEVGGLKPDEALLDVGCGIGRKSIYLTRYLSTRGRYEGIDIVKSGIDWCSRTVTPRFPNFTFTHIDIYNKYYNTATTRRADEYRFPFPDRNFDLLTMGSVFTHMLEQDVENYLRESARVLKPGGRSLISWFVMNEETREMVKSGRSSQAFVHPVGHHSWTSNAQVPEEAIAFDESYLRDLYSRSGLKLQEPIHFGSWCGRSEYLSYQDLVLAVKA